MVSAEFDSDLKKGKVDSSEPLADNVIVEDTGFVSRAFKIGHNQRHSQALFR
jgi:hypothetical protein